MRLAAFMVLACGTAAFAQPLASGSGSMHWTALPGEVRANEYQIDDGIAEDSIGLTAGGALTWANRFTSAAGLNSITSINVAFGTPAALNGTALTAAIWSDPNNDGNPADSVLLSSVAGVVSGAADTTPANVFVTYDFPDVVIPTGQNFFVGISMTHAAGHFPAAIDTSTAAGRSWIALGSGFNPPNTIGEIGSFGFPGNWQIRANAVPAPGSIALLGLGGLLAARRRRA